MDIILKREVHSKFQLWYRPLSCQRYAFLISKAGRQKANGGQTESYRYTKASRTTNRIKRKQMPNRKA